MPVRPRGRDERLLVRASESSRYSESEGRASRCDGACSVGQAFLPALVAPRRQECPRHSRHPSTLVATCRYPSISRTRTRTRTKCVSVGQAFLPARADVRRQECPRHLAGFVASQPRRGSAGVDRGLVPERFMERAQAPGARGLRGMITAGWRTVPPGTACSTFRPPVRPALSVPSATVVPVVPAGSAVPGAGETRCRRQGVSAKHPLNPTLNRHTSSTSLIFRFRRSRQSYRQSSRDKVGMGSPPPVPHALYAPLSLAVTSRLPTNHQPGLHRAAWYPIITAFPASIAQLVEQLICNQQVVGSNPSAGST